MNHITASAIFVALGIGIAIPSNAVEVRGRVNTQSSGIIVPRSNVPVALVHCDNPNQAIQNTPTDPNGMYFFPEVAAGSYCINIPNFNMFPITVPDQPVYDVPLIMMPN